MDSSLALMRICSYPPFNDRSSLTVGGFLHVSSQHQWNTWASSSSSSSFSTDEKKKKGAIKVGLRKRKFKLSVCVLPAGLESWKPRGKISVGIFCRICVQAPLWGGGEERSLGLPQSFGKNRQVAPSSREDSIINDASTQSHLGIPGSGGDPPPNPQQALVGAA